MIILVLIIPLIFLIHAPSLIRQKYWRDLIIFCLLLAVALLLSILISLDIPVPNPLDGSIYLIKDVLHLSYDQ